MTDAVFSASFEIRVYETDHLARLTPVTLFNYLQETATRHVAARGSSMAELAARGLAWFLTDFRLSLARYPRRGEVVTVKTWGRRLKGLFAHREFEIIVGGGSPCGVATSRWVVVDLARRRLVRLDPALPAGFPTHPAAALEEAFEDLPEPARADFSRTFHVRLSDLDPNQHANSASYFDWLIEATPPATQAALAPLDMRIAYRREARAGAVVEVQSQAIEARAVRRSAAPGPRPEQVFLHAVRLKSDAAVLALGRTVWGREEPPGRV